MAATPPGSPGQTKAPAEAAKPQPSYTQQQADRDAAALYDATLSGVTGWGTDEDKVFKTLKDKSPEQLALIRKSFQEHYKKNLDNVLRGEMSGADRKHVEALLQGNAAKSDAVTIQARVDSVFGSSEEILKTLEKRSPKERHAIAQEYAAMNGGVPAGQSPEDFMLSKLKKELDPGEMSRARSLLGASQAKSPAESSALELQSLKEGLKKDMKGWGTDEGRIFERLEKATPEQRKALLGDKALVGRLKDDLSKEDYSRAMGLLQGNQAQADAARIRESMNGFLGADKKGVRGMLEGKTPEQLNAIKAEYQKQTGKSLESVVRSWSGADAEVTLRLLNPPKAGDMKARAEASAERLHLAMDRMGTDEDALRAELGDKSKAELDAIATAYKKKYGKDLRQELDGELDGRDQFELLEQSYDLGAINPNDPNAARETVRRLRAQQENEKGFGTRVLDNVQRGIKGEADNDRLDRNLEAADKAIQSGDTQRAQTLAGYATDDVKSLQSSKDSLADTAATAGVAVVTTAAVVATGGAATPLAIAGYAALGATTRTATYAAFQGNAAGSQELGRQMLIGTAEGATVVLPVGKGASAIASVAPKNTLQTAAKQGFKEGTVGGAAGGAVDAATRSETWDNGFANGLRQVVTHAGVDGLVGGATGGLASAGMTGAAQAFQPREIPRVENPELPGNTTRVCYDNGRVHIETGPGASHADIQAHMETARTLQKYEGPIGQIRRMRDRIQQMLTGMPGYGTQGFESRLEVKKLQGILTSLEGVQQRIDDSIRGVSGKTTPATLAEREALQQEIANVESQLRTHAAQVDSLAPGRGFVAMEGMGPRVQAGAGNIGEQLDTLIQQMKQAGRGDVAPGGSIQITVPPTHGKNNVSPSKSVELIFSPEDLYVRSFKVGGTEVKIKADGERYPSRPLFVLKPEQVEDVIWKFNKYVEKGGDREISLTRPPEGLDNLPDLIAMVAEGSRFPDIRNHIKSLESGRDGLQKVWNHGHEEFERLPSNERKGNYDFSRIIPRHYINNWEERFLEGNADFRMPHWKANE